jgi:transcriptional regulator with XRE-family HTH domain
MELGIKIRKIRELRNYTQEYMAQKLSMSQTGYSKIERNECDINISKLQQIADVFEMPLTDILDFNQNTIFGNQPQKGVQPTQNTAYFEKERKLYETIIEQQKEQINFLKNLLTNQ